ncbi:MAG TPA: hypothetical protein VHC69_33920 [Polyangiaceae bacterium]|nr:hypothetical protein [Polyangiaceae bacterium]
MRLLPFTSLLGVSALCASTAGDVLAAPRVAGAPKVAAAPRIAGAPRKPAPRKAHATKPSAAESAPPAEESAVSDAQGREDAPPAPDDAAAEAASDEGGKLDEKPPPQTAAAAQNLSPLNPEPNESPKPSPAPGPEALDKLIADIATLRARVAALTTSLFSSKLRVYVHTDGDDARVQSFVVTLDDGVVFKGEPGFVAEDEKIVYEHAVAPGSHVVGIEVERQDARGASYRTWQTTRFAIQVPERQTLEAIVDVEDDSNMAADFPDDQDGKYALRVKLRAKVAK